MSTEEVSNFQVVFLFFYFFSLDHQQHPTLSYISISLYVYFLFFSTFLIYHLLPNLTLTQIFLFSFKELKKNFNHTLQPKRKLTKKSFHRQSLLVDHDRIATCYRGRIEYLALHFVSLKFFILCAGLKLNQVTQTRVQSETRGFSDPLLKSAFLLGCEVRILIETRPSCWEVHV